MLSKRFFRVRESAKEYCGLFAKELNDKMNDI